MFRFRHHQLPPASRYRNWGQSLLYLPLFPSFLKYPISSKYSKEFIHCHTITAPSVPGISNQNLFSDQAVRDDEMTICAKFFHQSDKAPPSCKDSVDSLIRQPSTAPRSTQRTLQCVHMRRLTRPGHHTATRLRNRRQADPRSSYISWCAAYSSSRMRTHWWS